MSMDLLLVCTLANAACAVTNLMTALIFVIHHCLSLACILSCCCLPLIPPSARGSCGDLSFPTESACWRMSQALLPNDSDHVVLAKTPTDLSAILAVSMKMTTVHAAGGQSMLALLQLSRDKNGWAFSGRASSSIPLTVTVLGQRFNI